MLMDTLNLKNRTYYLFLAISLSFTILVLVILIFFNQRNTRIVESKKEITSVAKSKIKYLSRWYEDEVNDANLITSGNILQQTFLKWNKDKSATDLKILSDALTQLKLEHDYENIYLVNSDGKIILPEEYNSCKEKFISDLIKSFTPDSSTLFSDIQYCEIEKRSHLFFLNAIPNTKHFIAFELNPDKIIYSQINQWPTPSNTAEIYLARKQNDSLLVISELKFRPNSAFNFKYSLDDSSAAVVKAAKGFSGIVRATDYRDQNVLAYVDKIPGTNWLIVTKVDLDEILSAFRFEALLLAVFVILMISLLWLGLAFFYNYRQKNLFRNLWRSQEEFKTTLYSIGDAVITTNKEGKVKYINPIAEKLTGWTESQARGKKLNKVFHIVNEYTREEVENPVDKVLEKGIIVGLADHTVLISKDGREIPIADSGAPIRDEDGNIVGVVFVFRDQSKERELEKTLKESEESYRGLFNSVQEAIYIQDENGIFLDVNEGAVKMYGYDREYFIGKTPEFVSAPGLNDLPKVAQCVQKAFNGEPQ